MSLPFLFQNGRISLTKEAVFRICPREVEASKSSQFFFILRGVEAGWGEGSTNLKLAWYFLSLP